MRASGNNTTRKRRRRALSRQDFRISLLRDRRMLDMHRVFATLLVLSMLCPAPVACAQDYKLGPDSQRQPGVPQGDVTHATWTSRVFPGTTRDYWVYVPKQYDPAKPACVMVFQDGGGF